MGGGMVSSWLRVFFRGCVHARAISAIFALVLLCTSNACGIALSTSEDVQAAGGGGAGPDAIAATTGGGDGNESGFIQDVIAGTSDVGLSEVNQTSGAYSFSIPLPLPPGINGLIPSVGISYSSDTGKDTSLGAGFELAAADCIIRRAPSRLKADGSVVQGEGTPQFSSDDTFYYQGQRLVPCSGSQSCPSGTYRTEQDNFARVQSQTAAVPNGFVVTQKDGTVMEYGNGQLAYGASDTFNNYTAYCASRVVRLGNEIAYTYKNFGRNGAVDLGYDFFALDKIEYGGQSAANHRWRVQFNWGTRPAGDVRDSYRSGGLTRNVKRLDSIDVYALGTPLKRLRRLEINYEAALSPDSSRSRVQSILMRGETDSDILPGYNFSYPAQSTSGWTGSEVHNAGPEGLNNNNIFTQWAHTPSQDDYTAQIGSEVVDIDGDGLSDIVRHDDQLDKTVYLYNGTAWVDKSSTWGSKFANVDHFVVGSGVDRHDNGVRFADINGDGHVDILRAIYIDGSYQHKVWLFDPTLNSGSGGFESTSAAATAFDNTLGTNNVAFAIRKTLGGKQHSIGSGTLLADVNGDGLADIITGRGGDLIPSNQILINNGENFSPGTANYYSTLPVSIVDARNSIASIYWGTQIADLNGDGLPDLVLSYEKWNYQPDSHYRGIYCDTQTCEMIKTRQCPGGVCRSVAIWINNGHGWDDKSTQWNSNLTPDTTETFQEIFYVAGNVNFLHNYPRGSALVDVNGDGFADLVQSYCQAQEGPHPINPVVDCTHTKTYLGSGNGTFNLSSAWRLPYRATAGAVGMNDSYFFEYSAGRDDIGYCTCPYTVDYDGGMKMDDLNNDGSPDILMNRYSYVGQYGFVKKSQLRFDRDLLTAITDPFGQSVAISYKFIGGGDVSSDPSGAHSSASPLLPFKKVVVDSITRSNGSVVNPVSLTKSYHYYGGQFDEQKRNFAGYRLVTITEPSPSGSGSVVTASWFKTGPQDFCHPTAPEATLKAAAECAVVPPGTTNYVCLYDTSADLMPVVSVDSVTRLNIKQLNRQSYDTCVPGSSAPYFSPVRESREWNIESAYLVSGATHVVGIETKKAYGYDNFGNATSFSEYLYSSDAAPYRKVVTIMGSPNLSNWIVDRECSLDYQDGAGTSLKTDQIFYDNSSTICAAPSLGLPTEHHVIVRAKNGIPESTSITYFSYTSSGNVESIIDPRGNPTYTFWNSSLPEIVPARSVDALNHETRYGYDEFGNQTSVTDANNITMWATFDNHQRLSTTGITAAAGDAAPLLTYEYQLTRNPQTQYVALTTQLDDTRSTKQISYFDGFRHVFLKTNRDSGATVNYSTSYGYNSGGLLYKSTLPYSGTTYNLNKTATQSSYDLLGRVTSTTSPGGYVSNTVYSIYEPPSSGSLYWQDVSSPNVVGGDPQTRHKHSLTDPLERVVQLTECNTEACGSPATVSPDIYTTKYLYDVQNNQTDICMSNNGGDCSTSFSKIKMFYDGLGRLIARKDPDLSNCSDPNPNSVSTGCPWRLEYDLAGNMTRMTDASGTPTTFGYDKLNRLTSRIATAANGGNHAWNFWYDEPQAGRYNIGRLTRMSSYTRSGFRSLVTDSTNYVYGYDSIGRVRQKDITLRILGKPDQTGSFQYTYLNDGSLASITSPLAPVHETVSYVYDKMGRPSAVNSSLGGPIISLVQYNPLGQMTDIVWGLGSNEVHLRYDYRVGTIGSSGDDRRLAKIWTPESSLLNLAFDYDAAGNVTRQTDAIAARVHEPKYDRLNRMREFWLDGLWHDTFTLDSMGNRMSWGKALPSPGTSETLNARFGDAYQGIAGPHAMRCLGIFIDACNSPRQTFSYDLNGNMISNYDSQAGGTTTFTYNLQNKLESVSPPGGTLSRYYYGPNAEEFAVEYGGSLIPTYSPPSPSDSGYGTVGRTTYYVDPTFELREGAQISHYFLNGLRVASRWESGNVKYLLSDHLESVRAVIDQGNPTTPEYAASYLPHGQVLSEAGATQNFIKFNGHQKDANGLYNFDARTYSSALGSFLQPDSIVPNSLNPQTLNRYAFPGNNPATLGDPTGHDGDSGYTSTHYSSDYYGYDFYYDDYWSYFGDDIYTHSGGYRITDDSVFPCKGCGITEVTADRISNSTAPQAAQAASQDDPNIWVQSFRDGIIPTGDPDQLYDALEIFTPLPYIAFPGNLVNNFVKRQASAAGASPGVASALGFAGMLLTPGPEEIGAGIKGIKGLRGITLGQWATEKYGGIRRLTTYAEQYNLKVLEMGWVDWWKKSTGRNVPNWMLRAHDSWWIIYNHYILRHPMHDIGWAVDRGVVPNGTYAYERKLIDFLDNKLHLPHGPRVVGNVP